MTEILRKLLVPAAVAVAVFASHGAATGDADLAVRNVNRAMALIDASWDKTIV